jgi:hypothetical protein
MYTTELDSEMISMLSSASPDEQPMYFEHTSQIEDIFQGWEEKNLFLITNSKDREEQMEEINKHFTHVKTHLDSRIDVLEK